MAVTSGAPMLALIRSFPSLRAYEPAEPGVFNPVDFERWARGPQATSGSLCSARFVLEIWCGGDRGPGDAKLRTPFRIGLFSLKEALSVWDQTHRAAFSDFCRSPYWP